MKRKILSILAALSLGSPGAVARADDTAGATQSQRNTLGAVRVVREATETLVRIEGTRVPVFSVYTLQDPLRLVVDVSQGDVDRLETPIDVDDGVLTKVIAAQYGEGKRAVGRVIIGFSRRIPYDVKAEGNAVVVRVAAVGKERPSEAALRERDRRIEHQEAELKKARGELEARSSDAARLKEKDEELGKLRDALEARAKAAAEAEKRAREELAARESASVLVQEKDGEVARLRAEKEGEVTRLRAEKEGEVTRLRAETEGEVTRLRAERAEKEGEVTRLRAEKEGEVTRLRAEKEGEVTRLRAERAEKEGEVTRLRAERAEKEGEVTRLRADKEGEVTRLRAERAEKEGEVARLRAEKEGAVTRLRAEKEGEVARLRAEKEGELTRLRAELEARVKEAADTKAQAADAEKARQDELGRRQVLEQKLSAAEEQVTSLREKAQGSVGLTAALEKARAEVSSAAKVLSELRSQVASRADAETRARAEAADAASALQKAQGEMSTLRQELSRSESAAVERAKTEAQEATRAVESLRRESTASAEAARKAREESAAAVSEQKDAREREVKRLEGESRKLVERLFGAESRVKELEALRSRLEAQGSEAAAKEMLTHKTAEIEALRKRLQAAEGVAKATATELDRVRREEEVRVQKAEAARLVAEGEASKAREALEAGKTADYRKNAEARVALAGVAEAAKRAVVIRDVDFKAKEGHHRVVLRVDGDPSYVVTRKGDKQLVLDLPGARLPSHLRRKLDVSEFGGPVSVVSAYESQNPVQATRVMVELRGPASYEVTRAGQNLELEVKGEGLAAAPPKRLLLAQAGAPKDEVPEVLEEKKTQPKLRKRAKAKAPSYKGRRINLDLQDADIHVVLKLISEVIRLNFVVSDDVRGKVSMTLRDVPWDQALDIILKAKQLGYVREGNIVRVALEKVLRTEAEDEAKREVVVKESQPILLKIIPVNYAKAVDLLPRVKDVLSDKGAVSADVRTNQLIVRDIQQRIRASERLVKKLDTQTPQVLIEARIVEANTVFSREIGIQWGGNFEASPANGNPTGLVFPSTFGIGGGSPLGQTTAQGTLNPNSPNFGVNLPAAAGLNQGGAIGMTFGSIGGSLNLNLRLSAAEENGQAKIISAPKITTLDNQRATIQQGVSIPIAQSSALGSNTVFVDANLTLTVTPHVTLDGSVMMDIVATKNEPDFQRTGGLGDPTIIRKEARTSVLIKDGDTTVIGGIYTRNQSTNYRGVPLLSQIPILGWLFKKNLKQDNRTELLIFITPRIVNRPDSIGT